MYIYTHVRTYINAYNYFSLPVWFCFCVVYAKSWALTVIESCLKLGTQIQEYTQQISSPNPDAPKNKHRAGES